MPFSIVIDRNPLHTSSTTWSQRASALLLALVCCGVFPVCAQNRGDEYMRTVLAIQQQMQSGDLDGARTAIQSAAKQYPADGGLDNLLGVIEAQQGHASAARQAFLSAVNHNPQLTAAYLNLSRIDMQTASHDAAARTEALQMSEKVVQRDSANDEAHYQIATIYAWEKKYLQSLAELKKLSPQAQEAVTAQSLACEAHVSLGQKEATTEAVHKLAANKDLNEQDADACLAALRAARRPASMDELLSASAKLHALSLSGLRTLGLAQEAEGKLTEARSTLEAAFTGDSRSAAILIDLTRIARAAGDNQGALGYLAHARDLQPNNAALPYEFGVICLQMGLYAEARKAIGEALKIEPDNPEYNLGMGLVVSYSEDPSQALSYLQKYHAMRPQDPTGLVALGSTCFRTKDYDAAKQWLTQATHSASTAAEAHYYLGRIARQEGRVNDAVNELKESLRVHPDQSSVLAELGQIAVTRQDYSSAAAYLDHAVKIDPENYGANYGLLLLYARTNDPRRKEQAQRFEEVKGQKDARDLEMTRSFEIRRDGKSNQPEKPQALN
ncbi:MAG TPA: tetratricopeptide repeat protein [Acidobacteriaceae bacterium]|nr:tetratricopeptide repeat protein [Acidobacteriaceae bacterium]